jgi:hypothetical protein
MAINKLYWITHAPIAMLLGLCTCIFLLMTFAGTPLWGDSIGIRWIVVLIAFGVVVVYESLIAPIVEQHDPRLYKQSLWE